MSQYSKTVINHFRNPHNMGKIEDADGIGEVGNPSCGDIMYIYIKVKDNIITKCNFETFGCVSAIASSSMVTDMVKGKTIEQALEITNKSVVENLKGLPPNKVHCSVLAEEGIRAAIKDYENKKGK